MAAVAFEIDRFEEYRTRRGAKAATRAVSAFARVLDSNTREMDLCSRYEDNLFVCLLPRTGNGGAFSYALRVRKEVESSALLKGTGMTVSGGVAAYIPAMNHRTDLIAAAREALTAAIGEGRNRVMVCVPAREEDELEIDEMVAPWSPDGAADAGSGEPTRKRSAPVRTSLLAISRQRRR